MPHIRKARRADLADAEYICIQTASGILRKNDKMEKITALMFSSYYINEETEHCFVLEEKGRAVGYILCAPSAKRFARRYRKDNLKFGGAKLDDVNNHCKHIKKILKEVSNG